MKLACSAVLIVMATVAVPASSAPVPAASKTELFPLDSVRLLDSPFTEAVRANRSYLLAHDPDRLLAAFLREAGLQPRAASYGNWEGTGLDGHTAGHYLSALANMIASGADADGELKRRLDYMLSELERCQNASEDGYIGGVPGSRAFWSDIAAGRIQAHGFGINGKWVPWYNVHKTFAGLRDAYVFAGRTKARDILVKYGDWCEKLISNLSDEQMQNMLRAEHGGMNEALADIYAITREEKYLRAARRFSHKAVLDPLIRQEDRLTGMHANTQIPKVIGLQRISSLANDQEANAGAKFFWDTVVLRRSVAFGGNSVSEHFNNPQDFSRMLEHREGPETCNTYNMLRLTEGLFTVAPDARYADYYERALYNHILASIHPKVPGYVYFTPIRPAHYRVYSQPEQAFWCCVGSGMENPGYYGRFVYAGAKDALYVNLFIGSEVTATNLGVTLRQETSFPDEPRTRLALKLKEPATFTLHIRHPVWVAERDLAVRVNGTPVNVQSKPSSYVAIERRWNDGDRVEVELPMRTTVERLPDGSGWVAFLRGPIVLVSPSGTNDLAGLRADDTRMGHVAHGPTVPLDRVPVLVASADEVAQHVRPDAQSGPLRFRLANVVEPRAPEGLPLMPFFRAHDMRYQMYWQLLSREELQARRERIAAAERAKAELEARTLDWVAAGDQQPEVEHGFAGERVESDVRDGRRSRRGNWFQYTFNTRGEKAVELVVTYWGGERDRTFEIFANDILVATEQLTGSQPRQYVEKRYTIPSNALGASDNRVRIKFAAKSGEMTGNIYEVRLMRPERTTDD